MSQIGFFFLNFLLSISFFYLSLTIFNHSSSAQLGHPDFFKYVIGLFYLFFTPLVLGLLIKISKKLLYLLLLPISLIIIKFLLTVDLSQIKLALISNLGGILVILIVSLIVSLLFKSGFTINWPTINKKPWQIFIYLIVFLLIFFVIFNPKYKYSYEKLSLYGRESFHQFHHVNFYLMPVWEILSGKTLMVNADSQYGILLTYINSLIFKIIGVSYSNFVLYNMILTGIYCCLFFVFLKKVTNSIFWSVIGLVAYLKLFFFRYPDFTLEIYRLPSTTPIRYFFDIVVVYFIYQYFSQPSRRRLLILSGLVVFAFFYNVDFGAAILIAYLATIFTQALATIFKKDEPKKIFQQLGKFFLPLTIFFIGTIAIIVVFSYFRSGAFPNWFSYLYLIFSHTSNQYPGNLFLTSMQAVDYYYLPIAIYIVCYYYLLHRFFQKQSVAHPELVFLLFYGLMIFIYYVNLSEPNHLWTIIHPALLIFFILVSRFFKTINQEKQKWSLIQIFLLVLLIVIGFSEIFYSPVLFLKNALVKFQYRYAPNTSDYYHWAYQGTDIYLSDNNEQDFQLAADRIDQLTAGRSAVIISRYSPLLYLMTKKTSLIDHPNPECDFVTVNEFYQAVDKIKQVKPEHIFIYADKYNQYYLQSINTMGLLWDQVKDKYSFQEHAGAVDVYRLR